MFICQLMNCCETKHFQYHFVDYLLFLSSQHLSVSQHSSSLPQQSSGCCLPHASSLQQLSGSQQSSSFSQQSSTSVFEQFFSLQHSVSQQSFSSSQQSSTPLLDIFCQSKTWICDGCLLKGALSESSGINRSRTQPRQLRCSFDACTSHSKKLKCRTATRARQVHLPERTLLSLSALLRLLKSLLLN